MTDAELRDAAWAELKQTTVGWNKVAGYSPATLATTHWGKAKALLDQIGGAAPPPPPPPPPPSGSTTVDGLFRLGDARGIVEAWYTPLGPNPEVDSSSASWVQKMGAGGGLILTPDSYGVTVVDAAPVMQTVHVSGAGGGAGGSTLQVPIPSGTHIPGGNDGQITVLGPNCMYDLYQVTYNNGWYADGGMAQAFPSIGYYPQHASCRGSGLVLLLGLVRPDELAAGHIPHALALFFAQGDRYIPSRANQGSGSSGGLPNGARFFLPADYNVGQHPDYIRVIARAAQEYGLILLDGSPNATVQCATEYKGQTMKSLGLTGYPSLPFWSALKLEKLPASVAKASESAVTNGCTQWA